MSPGIMSLARNCPLETTGNLISCLFWNLKQWVLEGKRGTLPPCTPYIPIRKPAGGESGLMGGGGTALFPVDEKIPREPVPGLCPAPALPWQDCVVCSESTRGGTSDSGKVPSLPWASVSPSVQGVDEIVSVSKLSDCPPTLTF